MAISQTYTDRVFAAESALKNIRAKEYINELLVGAQTAKQARAASDLIGTLQSSTGVTIVDGFKNRASSLASASSTDGANIDRQEQALDEIISFSIGKGLSPINAAAIAVNTLEGVTNTDIANIPNAGRLVNNIINAALPDSVKQTISGYTPQRVKDFLQEETGYLNQDYDVVDALFSDSDKARDIRSELYTSQAEIENANELVFEALNTDPETGELQQSYRSLSAQSKKTFAEQLQGQIRSVLNPDYNVSGEKDGFVNNIFSNIGNTLTSAGSLVENTVRGTLGIIDNVLEEAAVGLNYFAGGAIPSVGINYALTAATGIPFPYKQAAEVLLSPFNPRGQELADRLGEEGIFNPTLEDLTPYFASENQLNEELRQALMNIPEDQWDAYTSSLNLGSSADNILSGDSNILDEITRIGESTLNRLPFIDTTAQETTPATTGDSLDTGNALNPITFDEEEGSPEGVVDLGEQDSSNLDSDGDGFTDAQEIDNGTDIFNPNDFGIPIVGQANEEFNTGGLIYNAPEGLTPLEALEWYSDEANVSDEDYYRDTDGDGILDWEESLAEEYDEIQINNGSIVIVGDDLQTDTNYNPESDVTIPYYKQDGGIEYTNNQQFADEQNALYDPNQILGEGDQYTGAPTISSEASNNTPFAFIDENGNTFYTDNREFADEENRRNQVGGINDPFSSTSGQVDTSAGGVNDPMSGRESIVDGGVAQPTGGYGSTDNDSDTETPPITPVDSGGGGGGGSGGAYNIDIGDFSGGIETPTVPTDIPTDTPVIPTDTPDIPTDTPVIPTDTPVIPTDTPTDTPAIPTDTPTDTSVIPTDTPTDTSVILTDTPDIPTDTPDISTDTPVIPTDLLGDTPIDISAQDPNIIVDEAPTVFGETTGTSTPIEDIFEPNINTDTDIFEPNINTGTDIFEPNINTGTDVSTGADIFNVDGGTNVEPTVDNNDIINNVTATNNTQNSVDLGTVVTPDSGTTQVAETNQLGFEEYDPAFETAKILFGPEAAQSFRGIGIASPEFRSAIESYQRGVTQDALNRQKSILSEEQEFINLLRDRQAGVDTGLLEEFGTSFGEAYRGTDPYALSAIDAQKQLSERLYSEAASGLTPDRQRNAEQAALSLAERQGRTLDPKAITDALYNQEVMQQNLESRAQAAGSQLFTQGRQFNAPIPSLLLGGQQPFERGLGQLDPTTTGTEAINIAAQNYANRLNAQKNDALINELQRSVNLAQERGEADTATKILDILAKIQTGTVTAQSILSVAQTLPNVFSSITQGIGGAVSGISDTLGDLFGGSGITLSGIGDAIGDIGQSIGLIGGGSVSSEELLGAIGAIGGIINNPSSGTITGTTGGIINIPPPTGGTSSTPTGGTSSTPTGSTAAPVVGAAITTVLNTLGNSQIQDDGTTSEISNQTSGTITVSNDKPSYLGDLPYSDIASLGISYTRGELNQGQYSGATNGRIELDPNTGEDIYVLDDFVVTADGSIFVSDVIKLRIQEYLTQGVKNIVVGPIFDKYIEKFNQSGASGSQTINTNVTGTAGDLINQGALGDAFSGGSGFSLSSF